MSRIIFICTGNICRSPMAEGILKQSLAKADVSRFSISSMGIHGLDNQKPTIHAVRVCAEKGIDISAHRSRPLVPDELNHAALALTMEPVQAEYIKLFFPPIADRVFLLTQWPDKPKRLIMIKDPIDGSIKFYKKTFDLLAYHIDRILPEILALPT